MRLTVSNLIGRSSTACLAVDPGEADDLLGVGHGGQVGGHAVLLAQLTPASAIALRTVVAVVVTSCRVAVSEEGQVVRHPDVQGHAAAADPPAARGRHVGASERTPSSISACETVRPVVQTVRVSPSTVSSTGRPYRTCTVSPSASDDDGAGVTRSCARS